MVIGIATAIRDAARLYIAVHGQIAGTDGFRGIQCDRIGGDSRTAGLYQYRACNHHHLGRAVEHKGVGGLVVSSGGAVFEADIFGIGGGLASE